MSEEDSDGWNKSPLLGTLDIADKRKLPPLGTSLSKLRPADEKARIDAMVDEVAAREKAAKSKETARNAIKEMRATLGTTGNGKLND